MRSRLESAPIWVFGPVSGVLFGLAMTVWPSGRDGDASWTERVIVGVLAGAAFGVVMGRFLRRGFGMSRDELAALPIEQRRAVLRAAVRGPAPADPAVRAAALRRVSRTHELLRRRPRFSVAVSLIALVVYAVQAVTRSPWWWLAFAMFCGFLALRVTARRRIERRMVTLSTPSTAS